MIYIITGFFIAIAAELTNVIADLLKDKIKKRFPRLKVGLLKIIFHSLTIIGIVISLVAGIQSENESYNNKNYDFFATLDPQGETGAGRTLLPSFVTDSAANIITNAKVGFNINCDLNKIDNIISQFPFYPFGYYYKAVCLQERNDPNWRYWAQKAVDGFKITTTFQNHNEFHDYALSKLKNGLKDDSKIYPL